MQNLSLTQGVPQQLNKHQKIATAVGVLSLFILLLSAFNIDFPNQALWFFASISLLTGSIIYYAYATYKNSIPGIKNNGVWFNALASKGVWGWMIGILLTSFYVVLYFFPQYLGLNNDGANTGLISFFDPLSKVLSGNPASQWFVYGTFYTIAVVAFGVKFIWKYRHNSYQRIRTISVMFFQLGFAFIIPELMARLNGDDFYLPYYDLKNIWPLNYYNFEQYRIDGFINAGNIGLALLFFGILSTFVITPILTYKYGKRWYCSWVCGCGGLAETAGDPFRHLSDKSMFAWKVERWVIHSVLVFVVLMTTAVIYSYLGYDAEKYWLDKNTFLISVAVFLGLVLAGVFAFKKNELKKDARY
ncbi:MAG: 4Fe-4S binding protein, partial [Flavobacteriaceae bacterium]|nr:4Fe-4S binding protein [Flavobacteriaceae bacterium]